MGAFSGLLFKAWGDLLERGINDTLESNQEEDVLMLDDSPTQITTVVVVYARTLHHVKKPFMY